MLSNIRSVHNRLTDDEFESSIDVAAKNEQVVTRKFLSRVGTGAAVNLDFEWYTPEWILERVRTVMGSIDLDPASCELANQIVRAKQIFTQSDDGMEQTWYGNVFMNPPFARGVVTEFCTKLISENENIKQWIILINCMSGAPYFHSLLEVSNVLCFVKGYHKFGRPQGLPPAKTMYANVLIGRVNDSAKFRAEFNEIGYCLATD